MHDDDAPENPEIHTGPEPAPDAVGFAMFEQTIVQAADCGETLPDVVCFRTATELYEYLKRHGFKPTMEPGIWRVR